MSSFIISRYLRDKVGPERFARLQQIDREIITIPDEWLKADLIPPDDVVDFQTGFYRDIQMLNDRYVDSMVGSRFTTDSVYMKLRRGEDIAPAEQDKIEELVQALKPIIRETSAAVTLSGYTADMQLYTTTSQPLEVLQFSRLLSIGAIQSAREGHYLDAIDKAALPILYMKHPVPSGLLTEVMAFSVTQEAVTTLYVIADMCNDPGALKYGLTILDSWRESAKPESIKQWELADSMSMLLRARAVGYPVDVSPQTYGRILFQFGRLLENFEYWAIEQLPHDDLLYKAAQERLLSKTNTKHHRGLFDQIAFGEKTIGMLSRLTGGFGILAWLAEKAAPPAEESYIRGLTVFAQYDQTRLHFAQRLNAVQQTTGSAVSKPAQRSPANSPIVHHQTMAPDPFTSGPMLFTPINNKFYSAGPDKDDDSLKTWYDPTNGTLSNGDVAVKPTTR